MSRSSSAARPWTAPGGFKKECYPLSMEVAEPLFRQIREVGPDQEATDCPLAALQFAQGTGLEPRHPIQVLAAAGFRSTEPVTRDREVSVEKIRLGDVKNLSEYEKVRDAV